MFRPHLLTSLVLATASGCVTVYQPVTALQRPVTVDPAAPNNFTGLRLLVRCVPAAGADQGESEELCQNLSTLYTNQGATVDVEIPDEAGGGGVQRGEAQDDEEAGGPKLPGKPDLIVELKARRVHSEHSAVLWAVCIASLTLIPHITEATYAQDVVIRDAEGFLLIADTLQARFIRYFGLGFWAVNGILDLVWREKGEGLIGNNHKRDFSKDFHGQMSQLAFHAQMRARILQSFSNEPPPEPAAEKPPEPKK